MNATVIVAESNDKLALQLKTLLQKKSLHNNLSLVAIAGGSLPQILSLALIQNNLSNDDNHASDDKMLLDVFLIDERLVDLDDKDSNYNEVKRLVIPHLREDSKLHHIDTNLLKDGAACAKSYSDEYQNTLNLQRKSSFDCVFLGVGPDGHIASLFPNHPLLDEIDQKVAFISDSPKPPSERITFTYPVINSAQMIIFIVTGGAKKQVVKAAIERGEYPCGKVQNSGNNIYWFLDSDAASLLDPKYINESWSES